MAKKNFYIGTEKTAPAQKNHIAINADVRNDIANLLPKYNSLTPFPLDYLDDIPVNISEFITPVFDNIIFEPGAYSILNEKGELQTINFAGLTINTVIIEASQEKNIIKTPIQGKPQAVKEYISSNDTIITINGEIVRNIGATYPKYEVKKLKSILDVPQQLKVKSKFINDILGIEWITIESWRLVNNRGFRNVQPFVINAISDVPPEDDNLEVRR